MRQSPLLSSDGRTPPRVWAVFGAAALLLTAVPLAAPSLAQPAEGVVDSPKPDYVAQQESGVFDKTAYYTANASRIFPRIATSEFPPGVACLVIPESCSEDAEQIGNVIEGGIGGTADGLDTAPQPVQPVPPESLPVGLLTGEERYSSAVRFALPPLPDGQMVSSFTLTMPQRDESFSMESPAFRGVVAAAVAQAREETRGPEAFQNALAAAAGGETALLEVAPTGIEACPVIAPFEAGENQPLEARPEVDCILGTGGVFDEAAETWTFELGFAAQAWYDGTLPNEGIVLRPLGAQNVDFGDPDYSTNFVLYLEPPASEDALAASFVDEPEPLQPPPPPPPAPRPPPPSASGGTFGGGAGTGGGSTFPSGGSGTAQTIPSSGTGTAVPSAGLSGTPALDSPGPPGGADVTAADVPELSDPALATTGSVTAADPLASDPGSLWYLWLLLPMTLAGGWWYGRVVDVLPEVATPRAGAMTRLLRLRGFSDA